MSEILPVNPSRARLPFFDRDFTWDVFEEFFCSFLAAQPTLTVIHDGESLDRQIKTARPYGKRGASQKGIDICATVEGGGATEEWAFQCKHYKSWTPKQTEKTIADCKYKKATHKFLLVTCDVGEDSREVIREHPDWALWDGRDIAMEFLTRMASNPSVGAEILYRCFGKDWDTKFFSVRGTSPLLTPDAFFAPWREEGLYFHHKLDLVGRKDRLSELDAFAKNSQQRVLLLTGRGGIGKSRLLAEWTKDFSRRHSGVLVRFANQAKQDIERYFPRHGERMVIVLDDAHQEEGLRKQLLCNAIRHEGVQLVLSLRPGPNESIRQELYSAGFDILHILELRELGNLSDDDSRHLAREAIGLGFSEDAYYALYKISSDCPLIAVIGGALIRSGEVSIQELGSHRNVRLRVFEQLEKQAHRAEGEVGHWQEIKDFLGLVALLSPVRNDEVFRAHSAKFLGADWQPHRISVLIEALENCGVLLAGGWGLRITPDLFSDHIAYRACYNHHGNATGFVDRVLEIFSDKATESVVRHLAEAEWRANEEHEQPESIIHPVWDMFRSQFLAAESFFQRTLLLDKWREIAVLRPYETLELVDLAIQEKDIPTRKFDDSAFNDESSIGQSAREIDSYASVLDHLPALLKATGAHHQRYTARSLDILWRLARDRVDDENNNQNHPLAVMASVVGYDRWKPPAICKEGLRWIESFFAGDDWLHAKPRPAVILRVLVKPFFAVWLEAHFWMRQKVMFHQELVSLEAVSEMRDRALAICRTVLERAWPGLTIAVLDLVADAASPLHPPFGGSVKLELEQAWLPERAKALAVIGNVIAGTTHPAIHVAVRRRLLQVVKRPDDDGLIPEAKRLLAIMPDTLEIRTTRALYSYAHEEYEGPMELDRVEVANEQWAAFLTQVARELEVQFGSSGSLAEYLAEIVRKADEAGWQNPGFRVVLGEIAKHKPKLAAEIAEFILLNPDHRLAPAYDLLVHETTRDDLPRRLDFYRRALSSGHETLCASAVYGMSWWRRDGELPDEAWVLIEDATPTAPPAVAWAIANFVDFRLNEVSERDINLLSQIPLSPEANGLSARVLWVLGTVLSRQELETQSREAARQVLGRLVAVPNLEEADFRHALGQIGAKAPTELFEFLSARHLSSTSGEAPKGFRALPFWSSELPIFGFAGSPSYHQTVLDLGKRLLRGEPDSDLVQLVSLAVFHGSSHPEPVLNELLDLAETAEQLERLLILLSLAMTPLVLHVPAWAKRCLGKAREFSIASYKSARDKIFHNCIGGGSGFSNGEPDPATRGRVETIERLAHTYANDAELGPLFAEAASFERATLKRYRDEYLRQTLEG